MPGAKLRKNACNGHGRQLTDLMPELQTLRELQELQELQELRELQQLWEALSDIWPRSELCRQLIVWQRLFTAWLEVLLIVLPLPVHKLLTGINDGWPFQKWLESPICIIITLPSHPVWPRCPLRTVNFTMMYLSLSQVNPYMVLSGEKRDWFVRSNHPEVIQHASCCGQLWVWHTVCGQTCDGLYHFAFYLVNR